MLSVQHLPPKRTAELMSEVLRLSVSQGSFVSWQADAAAALVAFDETLAWGLSTAPVPGADETGIRVNGNLAWVHAVRTEKLTRYTVSPRRGYTAMEDAGVLVALKPGTVLTTDFFKPYWRLNVIHAVCGAHLSTSASARFRPLAPMGRNSWPLTRLDCSFDRVT